MRLSGSSRAELKEFRDARLRELLVHAYERVPYYRKLFDRNRLHPRHVRGTIDLDLIPITGKQELRGLPEKDVLASGIDPARLLTVRTSGSTGEPFTIRRTWLEDKRHHLLRLRAMRSIGLRWTDRRVAVGLVRPASGNDRKLIGKTLSAVGINRTFRIHGLESPELIAQQLQQLRPTVITGMPGMLCRVADYIDASGAAAWSPRLLIVSGETLSPFMQRRLTEVFGAPVRQTYASHEFPLLGWECSETGEFHTCDDGVIFEVLREDGSPAWPGEQGQVVATNLNARAMPLIRYRMGDFVIQGEERCACGKPFSTIRAIQGRTIDCFMLPDGRVLHPYQILTSFIGGADSWIRQYQLLQERRDRIILRVIPVEPPGPEHVARVEQSVRSLLGSGVEFRVQLVSDFSLEASGKFRSVRSLVTSTTDSVPVGARA
jgi:phenylacetate-CoA ligase